MPNCEMVFPNICKTLAKGIVRYGNTKCWMCEPCFNVVVERYSPSIQFIWMDSNTYSNRIDKLKEKLLAEL